MCFTLTYRALCLMFTVLPAPIDIIKWALVTVPLVS